VRVADHILYACTRLPAPRGQQRCGRTWQAQVGRQAERARSRHLSAVESSEPRIGPRIEVVHQNMMVKMKGKMLGMGVATFFDAGGLQ
jgi:hypothetical protein